MTRFKERLAKVFDDDLRTRPDEGNNTWDIVIIAVILLSTVSVFLTTFELSPTVAKINRCVDWFVLVFFTVEVSLRIWAADEIDPKYKGFWGRVRYCLSFYGFIDFIATYPLWLGVFCPSLFLGGKILQVLRVLRVARLFRVFRYMKAFRFLGDAFESKKREMLVSLEFIAIITVVLSFLLYLVEHDSNPEMLGDGWKSIVWAFAKYIEDPGKIADNPIVTPVGQIIAFLVGIMGIAFFAVPIGLLSAGLSEIIEKDRIEEETKGNVARLETAFSRILAKDMKYRTVPAYCSIATIQAKKDMDQKDIIDAVRACDHFRLRNLAGSMSIDDQTDRLVVESFPLNRPYGCLINRYSPVTIVAVRAVAEAGAGNYAWHLALFGGFNYVSREVELKPDQPTDYYNSLDREKDPHYGLFMDDLKSLNSRWVIFILSKKEPDLSCHFLYGALRGDTTYDDPKITVRDVETFDTVSHALAEAWAAREVRSTWSAFKRCKNFLGRELEESNAFTIRISYNILIRYPGKMALALETAKILKSRLDPEHPFEEDPAWKDHGYGYQGLGGISPLLQ